MATLAQHKIQHQRPRSKRSESTLSGPAHPSSARPPAHAHGLAHGPQVVSTDGAWCCAASKPHYATHHRRAAHQPPPPPNPPPPPPPPPLLPSSPASSNQEVVQCESPSVEWPSPGYCASPAMDAYPGGAYPAAHPASYTKFKNALNAGLLNPMSPPSPLDKTRSSPTLFEMMANEQDYHPRIAALPPPPLPPGRAAAPISAQDRQVLLQERVEEIFGGCSPGSRLGDPGTADVRLTLTSRDGLSVSVSVHRVVLVAHSRFFSSRLSDWWSRQQRSLPHLVEIADCDDIEAYAETLRLMYCRDLRRRLMREDVSKVLAILKVCAALAFDAGVLCCLEYLEAAPWAEDEEEKVAALLSQLQLQSSGAGEVLKRVSLEAAPSSVEETNENGEEVLIRLLHVVLEGKDEKARREMKGLVSKMLRENSNSSSAKGAGGGGSDLSKESLYSACDGCLRLLRQHFLRTATLDLSEATQIARQADNLHWILDILIDRQVAEKFLQTWAAQVELAEAHSRVPAVHRYEVSRVTARLFVGVGKGQILVSKEARLQLLRTWLEPFYEDFGRMRRACKGLDRHLIEDGLGNTILTLPLGLQQEILLAWFHRFLNSGDDCPNIQRGFEVWWRRAFWRRNGEPEQPPQLRIAAACENPC